MSIQLQGRIDSVNTLIKSDGLSASEFELISNVKVANTSTIDYKVTIPTEHLDDPNPKNTIFKFGRGCFNHRVDYIRYCVYRW